MTLGERIRKLRTDKSISQEKLAENLNVSRSTIAKWETDGGIPEISNLILLSNFFDVSLDVLVDNAKKSDITVAKNDRNHHEMEYCKKYYDIEMAGWNDGVFNVLIVNEDDKFLFYQRTVNNKNIYGLISKTYITSTSSSKQVDIEFENFPKIDRYYFLKKNVTLELAVAKGFIKGFFDFTNDDYMNVIISSFDETKVKLQFGKEIALNEITKIEELFV